MLEIYRKEDGVWIPFYPVDVNTNEVYESNLEGLPDCVMGKFMGGMVGYTPVWYYITIDKAKLRDVGTGSTQKK